MQLYTLFAWFMFAYYVRVRKSLKMYGVAIKWNCVLCIERFNILFCIIKNIFVFLLLKFIYMLFDCVCMQFACFEKYVWCIVHQLNLFDIAKYLYHAMFSVCKRCA